MTQSLLPAESTSGETSPSEEKWRQLSWLPCDITLDLPVARFRVRDLLQLRAGTVVETCYSRGAEIPLRANGQLIGWAEFEPVADHIGVRVTELI
jgi:flagellar motor switch/type III secretory pathway protein FliN